MTEKFHESMPDVPDYDCRNMDFEVSGFDELVERTQTAVLVVEDMRIE